MDTATKVFLGMFATIVVAGMFFATVFALAFIVFMATWNNGSADTGSTDNGCSQYHTIPNPCDPDSNN